ncbi:MAG: hypothetical protein NC548_18740 [Lachnospiraceae bacterium]|nr:hypothetical protein [Lachnospiraceae bacterium]
MWIVEAYASLLLYRRTTKTLRRSKEEIRKLDTYLEAVSAVQGSAQPRTIILPGLPHLEWMTENLSGFGGTEIDGRTYYTYDEAVEAVKQLGNGWRLPTRGEMVDLDDLGSTWDEDRRGRWFGGNHNTDHEGSLFLPASGFRDRETGALAAVGTVGLCWFSSPAAAGNVNAGYLYFYSGNVGPLNNTDRPSAFPVRCVRNLK